VTTRDDDPPGESPVEPPAPEPSPPDATPAVAAGPADAPASEASPSVPDEPLLPARLGDNALRDAVGVTSSPPLPPRSRSPKAELADDDLELDGEPRRRHRLLMLVAAAALVVGLTVAGIVLLGRVNSDRFELNCTTTHAIAEQGRAFPPWGTRPLAGAQWKAIPLPANARCKSEELDRVEALEARFLGLLLERASEALVAKNVTDTFAAADLDAIAAQLEQALLLSRAPERADQRKQVERLLGDVEYWRATLRLREAVTAMDVAARQYDAAALKRPLHVSDAGAWAALVRRLADDLRAGPGGASAPLAPSPPASTGDRPTAPLGTALPVEPEAPAAVDDAPADRPDAGLPQGGVLL
jgi:hypothetical protein